MVRGLLQCQWVGHAKGALMVVQGVSADTHCSTAGGILHANLKLRDVATLITQGMSDPLTSEETPNQRISRLLAAVVPQFNAPRELISNLGSE